MVKLNGKDNWLRLENVRLHSDSKNGFFMARYMEFPDSDVHFCIPHHSTFNSDTLMALRRLEIQYFNIQQPTNGKSGIVSTQEKQ